MKIVTLEEHVSFPEITSRIPPEATINNAFEHSPAIQKLSPKLADITGERLLSMDNNNISMQIVSVTGPGAELLNAETGPVLAKDYNDRIAQKIKDNTHRFSAFAHLPMSAPEAAADELERTVKSYGFKGALINGLTNNEFLDHPKFGPIFGRAESLNVPIYLHPGMPPQRVVDAYYSGLPNYAGMLLSIAGWGWHSETAIHVLRLFVSGVFDRYPKLKLIIGHMGEMIPMMMARCDAAFRPGQAGINQRTLIDTLQEQVHITTSGLFTLPPLITALDTFGVDNIMFSVDYPFSTNEQGSEYLDKIKMRLGEEMLTKIASANADKLLNLF